MALALLAILVMARSATGLTVTVAVALLLPGVGSVVPGGGVTLATLARLPLAFKATLTWKVTVALAPLAKVVLPEMALPTTTALMPALVVTPVIAPNPVGRVSLQPAPAAVLGPLLVMTIV